MDEASVFIGGYGLRFRWGTKLDANSPTGAMGGFFDSEENFQKTSTKYSTCMTTEEGPIDTRFEHCDTQWVCLN